MKRIILHSLTGIAFFPLLVSITMAHCEIPCGIYDDQLRIQMILENVTTIEKSMLQIISIEASKPHNANQLVRWITNKEQHANKLQEIVSQYFMTQRIKPDDENYQEKLATMHEMLIFSMKCKQTTDITNVDQLRKLVAKFEKLYFKKTKNH